MANQAELIAMANAPDTVDFVVRRNAVFADYVASNPYIKAGMEFTGDYQLAYVPKNMVQKVKNDLGSDFIHGSSMLFTLLGRESLNAAGVISVQNQPYLDLRGRGVLIGFVDTGIDYTLPAFRYEDGTSKIHYIWDQTIWSDEPGEWPIGTEYRQEQINYALLTEDPFSVVPHRDTVGHGTFLAAQAASHTNDDYIGAAPDAGLIVVKLRKARSFYLEENLVPQDQENVFESSAIMGGIDYIYKKAQKLKMPVVICVGVGSNMGGHDGFNLFSEYLSGLSHRIGVCLCTAAGNESQARHHTQGTVTEDGTEDIEVRVDVTGGNMMMQIWNLASDRVSVSVRSPVGEVVGRVPARSDSVYGTKLILEQARITIEYAFPLESSGGQLTRIKITDCTPGVWTITLYGDIILDGKYHAWLPITGLGSPGVEFLNPVPNGTIVAPAATIGTITSGAYSNHTGSLYPESSWGPTRLPSMSPDLVAPGMDVTGLFPGGRRGIMSGTSVATAITAGVCALMMQWGIVGGNDISLNTYRIKAFLIRGCIRDEKIGHPNNQWGYGKLDLYNSFRLMI